MSDPKRGGYEPQTQDQNKKEKWEARSKELQEKYGLGVEALEELLESDKWLKVEDVRKKAKELELSDSEPVIVRDFRRWDHIGDDYEGLTQVMIISEEQRTNIQSLLCAPHEDKKELFLVFPVLEDNQYLNNIINEGLLTQNGERDLSYVRSDLASYPKDFIPDEFMQDHDTGEDSSPLGTFKRDSGLGSGEIEVGIDLKTIDTIFEPHHLSV